MRFEPILLGEGKLEEKQPLTEEALQLGTRDRIKACLTKGTGSLSSSSTLLWLHRD